MWLHPQHLTAGAIRAYRQMLLQSCPTYVVIDGLFDPEKLKQVSQLLQQPHGWQTQQHTYDALYVNDLTWQQTPASQRFVQRDCWQRPAQLSTALPLNPALDLLLFLRSPAWMEFLSRLFRVHITDRHVAEPERNTNYFRLGPTDFVHLHADDSPGREICMLLYLNEDWQAEQGGELVFQGLTQGPVNISPIFNRCVLFDPASPGSEHWVNALQNAGASPYRYNVTSWYWS